ncbi:MAG: helix-turn-helix domain-containing protein [Algibacter sp.]
MKVSEDALEKDYISRINKALNFIDNNLDSELSLNTISKIVFYSPFHFHRIFKAIIGETLNTYITRRRIEKSASSLIYKKTLSVSEIAITYGFKDHSSFTRAFKKFYGVSPVEFRKNTPRKYSKICKTESKNSKNNLILEEYICNINNHLNWIKMNATIEIKTLPELHFASITHIGVNDIDHVFSRLITWATPKGLMDDPKVKTAIIFHDSFKITDHNKVRMNICLLTNKAFTPEGEITTSIIKKGKYIVGRFEIESKDFEKAWTSLFVWMNDKGYKKADNNPFEIFQNDNREHPEHKFIVNLHIPIE